MPQQSLPQQSVRPLNETGAHRRAEADIIARLGECWELTGAHKLLMSYSIDYALLRDRDVVGFAEVKDRDLPFGFGDGYYLSLYKAMRAGDLFGFTGLPCALVVRFRDGDVHWARFGDHEQGRLILAGRTDRGQPGDIEPHVVFPWFAFVRLA